MLFGNSTTPECLMWISLIHLHNFKLCSWKILVWFQRKLSSDVKRLCHVTKSIINIYFVLNFNVFIHHKIYPNLILLLPCNTQFLFNKMWLLTVWTIYTWNVLAYITKWYQVFAVLSCTVSWWYLYCEIGFNCSFVSVWAKSVYSGRLCSKW